MRRMIVGLLAVATACGSSTASPTTTSTTSQSTTTTTTAATSTTTVAPSTTVTTTATVADWTPPCVPASGGPVPSGPYAEAALDHFGPLPTAPILTVDLPVGVPLEGNPPESATPDVLVTRIEGGVLFAVIPGSGGASKTSILAAVNTDGSKRWVRCVDGRVSGVWAAPPSTQPATAVVAVQTDYTTTGPVTSWPIVSLADGSDKGDLAEVAKAAGIADTDFANHWQLEWIYPRPPTSLVVRRIPNSGTYPQVEQFVVYDLVTAKMTVIPSPEELHVQSGSLGFSDAGEPIVISADGRQVVALFHAGAWTRNRSLLRTARSVRPFFEGDVPSRLVGIDGLGATTWTENDLLAATVEGAALGTDGGVTVADVCIHNAEDGNCTEFALAGVNTKSGQILWLLPGFRQVSAHADGYVLATDGPVFSPTQGAAITPPGWRLLNDQTGKPVDASQQWADPDTFRFGCCGEGETVWVDHDGGVVIAVKNTRVSIWYPTAAAAGGATHSVSIP